MTAPADPTMMNAAAEFVRDHPRGDETDYEYAVRLLWHCKDRMAGDGGGEATDATVEAARQALLDAADWIGEYPEIKNRNRAIANVLRGRAGALAAAVPVSPSVADEACECGTPGIDYDGPDEDCPIHGGPPPSVVDGVTVGEQIAQAILAVADSSGTVNNSHFGDGLRRAAKIARSFRVDGVGDKVAQARRWIETCVDPVAVGPMRKQAMLDYLDGKRTVPDFEKIPGADGVGDNTAGEATL